MESGKAFEVMRGDVESKRHRLEETIKKTVWCTQHMIIGSVVACNVCDKISRSNS